MEYKVFLYIPYILCIKWKFNGLSGVILSLFHTECFLCDRAAGIERSLSFPDCPAGAFLRYKRG